MTTQYRLSQLLYYTPVLHASALFTYIHSIFSFARECREPCLPMPRVSHPCSGSIVLLADRLTATPTRKYYQPLHTKLSAFSSLSPARANRQERRQLHRHPWVDHIDVGEALVMFVTQHHFLPTTCLLGMLPAKSGAGWQI